MSLTISLVLSIIAHSVHASVFLASGEVIGRPIRCSEKEKLCFSFNHLFDAKAGKCVQLEVPCGKGKHIFVDKAELLRENGTLRPVCRTKTCDEDKLITASGSCLTAEEMTAVCGGKYATNIYGEEECVCKGNACDAASSGIQPPQGDCVVPDFSKTLQFYPPVVPVSESTLKKQCLTDDKFLFNGTCYAQLEQGPCDDGEWLVLNKTLFEDLRELMAVCDKRPCSPSEVWMAASQRCHSKEDTKNTLCRSEYGRDYTLIVHFFGEGYCSRKPPIKYFQRSTLLTTIAPDNGIRCPSYNDDRCYKPAQISSPAPDFTI